MSAQEEADLEATRALTLPQAKRFMRQKIADRRLTAEQGGFKHTVASVTTVYDSHGSDLARLSILASRARVAKAEAGAFSVRVVAADDSETAMNADELIALDRSAGDHFLACSANARTLRQAVNGSPDAASALSVDLEVGWP
jgi:hypothetical protein